MLPTVFFDKLCIPDAVVRSSRKLHKYIDKTIFPKAIRETLQRSSHLVEIFYDDKPKTKHLPAIQKAALVGTGRLLTKVLEASGCRLQLAFGICNFTNGHLFVELDK